MGCLPSQNQSAGTSKGTETGRSHAQGATQDDNTNRFNKSESTMSRYRPRSCFSSSTSLFFCGAKIESTIFSDLLDLAIRYCLSEKPVAEGSEAIVYQGTIPSS